MKFLARRFSSSEPSSSGVEPARALGTLSHDVDTGNALGLRNMAWKPATDSAVSPSVIDVNWLVQQSDLPFLVQALPAQLLHRSLVAHGLDDSLEVIEWIRGRQLVRFMDYEMWEHNAETESEDVSGACLVQWFRRWLEIGPQFAAERVSEFEEETLVLTFTKLLDIQVEGLSRFDAEAHDDYWTTVDGRFHLRVKDGDPASFEVIKQVVDSLYGVDIKWAGSVLSHAAMLVRSESLENALRWREGRMADVGFVPADEARSILRPRKSEALRGEISKAVSVEAAKRSYRERVSKQNLVDEQVGYVEFDADSAAELSDGVRALLQSMEPEMALRAVESSIGSEGLSRITDGAQLAPEFFVEDEDLMEDAISGVVSKTRALLLRLDVAGQRQFRSHRLFVERVFAFVSEENPVECADIKARLARVSNMFLSGTSVSFDADAQERALSVVRGCLNIGLEMAVSKPSEFGLSQLPESADSSALLVSSGAEVIKLVGPEFLFQLGWTALSELSVSVATAFEDALPANFPRAKTKATILAQEQRFADIRRWLSSVESKISAPVFHVVSSLLNRVPLYPEVLSVKDNAVSASAERRAFETLSDVESAKAFVANLARMDLMG